MIDSPSEFSSLNKLGRLSPSTLILTVHNRPALTSNPSIEAYISVNRP